MARTKYRKYASDRSQTGVVDVRNIQEHWSSALGSDCKWPSLLREKLCTASTGLKAAPGQVENKAEKEDEALNEKSSNFLKATGGSNLKLQPTAVTQTKGGLPEVCMTLSQLSASRFLVRLGDLLPKVCQPSLSSSKRSINSGRGLRSNL